RLPACVPGLAVRGHEVRDPDRGHGRPDHRTCEAEDEDVHEVPLDPGGQCVPIAWMRTAAMAAAAATHAGHAARNPALPLRPCSWALSVAMSALMSFTSSATWRSSTLRTASSLSVSASSRSLTRLARSVICCWKPLMPLT